MHIHTYFHTPAYRCHWPAVASHPNSPLIPLLLSNYHLGYALHMRLYQCQPSHFGFHGNPASSNGVVRLWGDKWLASVCMCVSLLCVSVWMSTLVIAVSVFVCVCSFLFQCHGCHRDFNPIQPTKWKYCSGTVDTRSICREKCDNLGQKKSACVGCQCPWHLA